MLTLYLARGLEDGYAMLQLPATPNDIGAAFAALDNISTDVRSTLIRDVSCPVYEVERYVRDADVRNDADLNSLNKLALLLNKFDNNQRTILSGALEIECVDGIEDVISILENMSAYSFFPDVTTERELGIYLVESGMMDFPENVRDYLDYARIGIEYHANHSGVFTDTGYVTREHEQELSLSQQPEYNTLRLFAPINCDLYEYGRYGDLEDYPSELSASESTDYADSIVETLEAYNQSVGPRGLAPYLRASSLADKVYSIMPTVEEYGGRLFGVMECQLREPLTEIEYADLCEECAGQMSDGYGEGLEQQEIKVNDGVLYVHLWNNSKDWSIQSEAQLKGEPEQGFGMQMQ